LPCLNFISLAVANRDYPLLQWVFTRLARREARSKIG